MHASYLEPHRIVSMLDAACMVNGRAFSVVCCEQTDAPRHWRRTDVTALRTLESAPRPTTFEPGAPGEPGQRPSTSGTVRR